MKYHQIIHIWKVESNRYIIVCSLSKKYLTCTWKFKQNVGEKLKEKLRSSASLYLLFLLRYSAITDCMHLKMLIDREMAYLKKRETYSIFLYTYTIDLVAKGAHRILAEFFFLFFFCFIYEKHFIAQICSIVLFVCPKVQYLVPCSSSFT